MTKSHCEFAQNMMFGFGKNAEKTNGTKKIPDKT